MRVRQISGVVILASAFLLSGCVVRTYRTTRDRVDQDLAGNRGYIAGLPAVNEIPADRKLTRSTQVVEVELHPLFKIEKKSSVKNVEKTDQSEEAWGNKGVIGGESLEQSDAMNEKLDSYKVQKGDTLQKISQKLYGTTKKWHKIFKANADTLKAPDKIYPGQIIKVPVASGSAGSQMAEPKDNLK